MNEMTPIPQNYKNNVNWILGAYRDADVTFPNGFQKDAIQNAVGARKTDKWKNWSCDISYVSNAKGCFVVVEDFGTVGLTGQNMPTKEVDAMMERGEKLAPEERLSRFTSMFNSGGNTTGGGLFGAGKSVYSVASETYTYYFDSLREDGKYVANVNQCGRVHSKAYEEEEAKEFILNKTGLSAKKIAGTRIIIEKPKAELKDSINSGTILSFIQESWWRIIERFDDSCHISINKIPVKISDNLKNSASQNFELPTPEVYDHDADYRVKHFGFYVYENGENEWHGISYYRKGMKIGEVDVKDIPDKLSGKYWGYIEVDEQWEDKLSEIEDKVHFGVSKGQRRTKAFQNLKNFCTLKVREKLIEWNYIKDQENENRKLKDELKLIAEELQDLFDKLKIEDLGKGPKKADFDVRWQDIKYPIADTEQVTSNDKINFSIRIKNSYPVEKRFEYFLSVKSVKTGKFLSQIDSGKILIDAESADKKDFIHIVNSQNSEQYAENRIVLSVKPQGSRKEKIKELSYFYDIERPTTNREIVTLDLHECVFPGDGRRVNFDERLRNVCYRLDNKRNYALNYMLKISIHNISDKTCPKILDVEQYSGVLKPFEEIITPYVNDIVFSKELYEQHLSSGILELRAKLIAAESDKEFERGDKITSFNYKIYFNCDEKNGKNDAFDIKSIEAADKYQRSWCVPGANRTIYLNIGHPAYLKVNENSNIQHEYLREQMLKQYVLLYLKEGKYEMFGEPGKEFQNLEPYEAAEQVIEKIEKFYAEVLK